MNLIEYNAAERKAIKTASYPAMRAFSPTYFHKHGVPTFIQFEEELTRYVDMMGEVFAFHGWHKALFTPTEQEQIASLREHVHDISGIWPFSNLLSPWPTLRVVNHLKAKQFTNPKIFECAAGCGYLGAYLLMLGSDYTGFDITQGLWLWSDKLWASLGESFAHWPWWEFARFHENPSRFDIVICDSALGEMNWFGYSYFIQAMLRMIGEDGYFVYSSVGDPQERSEKSVRDHLTHLGLYYDRSPQDVWVWSRRKPKLRMDKPKGKPLPDFILPDPLPSNYAFLKFAGLS